MSATLGKRFNDRLRAGRFNCIQVVDAKRRDRCKGLARQRVSHFAKQGLHLLGLKRAEFQARLKSRACDHCVVMAQKLHIREFLHRLTLRLWLLFNFLKLAIRQTMSAVIEPSFIERVRRSSWRERIDALDALWRVMVVRLLLATIGIKRIQALLFSISDQHPADFDAHLWGRRVVAIRRAAARVPGAVCLARSMTLVWWMAKAGLRAELHMGVRVGPRGADGHAWATFAGRALDESDSVIATYQRIQWS